MKVVLAFHQGDAAQAADLLQWCADLGGCPNHEVILLADAAVPWHTAYNLLFLAQRVFDKATVISPDRPYDETWPAAANLMWLFAARHIEAIVKEAWLWLEPDSQPLKPGWLDAIAKAYSTCPRPFMGAAVNASLRGENFRYIPGVAVYPANAASIVSPTLRDPGVAWDVAAAKIILAQAMSTQLIYCFWGEPNMPPSFDLVSTAPHVKTLDWLPPTAVLFHRNKDGSLIRLLRERLTQTKVVVVLPFCNKDWQTMTDNLRWMEKLHGQIEYEALLCYPSDTMKKHANEILSIASRCFRKVDVFSYRGRSTDHWPAGANHAWQSAAQRMATGKAAWAWVESDAVPLTPDWMDRLSIAYNRCGKPFFGPLVKGRNHMNGVAIYPADTPRRCPQAMRATNTAWDWVAAKEMIGDCHDASDLICHAWGEVNGEIHPFEGEAPRFHSVADVKRLVPQGAVLFHRNKDSSLQKWLAELLPCPALTRT